MSVQVYKNGIVSAGGSGVGENVMPNSLIMDLGSANVSLGRWRTAGSNTMTRARVSIADSPIGSCYGFQNSGTQTANDGSCYGIDNFVFQASTEYTLSFWARTIDGTGGKAGFAIYSCTYNEGSFDAVEKAYHVTALPDTGEWTRCWQCITTNTSTTRNIYIGITTGSESVTTQMCGVKIELGSHPTPWTPAPSDSIYVGAEHDFIETDGSIAKFYSDFAEANEFIEY